jgi:hypothetical protein
VKEGCKQREEGTLTCGGGRTLLNFHYVGLKLEVYFILVMYLNNKQMQVLHSQLLQ